MVLFGYIARMARAGTIEALDADYTRTAFLKGLPTRTVIRRHVLRNSLLPTIAVIATQMGYLIGGLVVVEKLFNYNGIGQRILTAATNKDFTMLESSVLVIAIVYLVATLVADILYSVLNPRIRHAAADMSTAAVALARRRPDARAALARAARRCALLARSHDVRGRGRSIILWWVFCAFFGATIAPYDPTAGRANDARRARAGTTSSAPTSSASDVLSRVLAGRAQHPHDRPAGDRARDRRRDVARPRHRLHARRSSTTWSAASSRRCSRSR